MNEQMRRDLTPQGYIRKLFAETENGKLTVSYENSDCNITYQVNWAEEDAERMVQRYNLLTTALARIAKVHDQLDDKEKRKELLSEADLEIWSTYVRPYEPMEVNWDELYPIPPCEPDELPQLIQDIHDRDLYGDLIEEEHMLLDQYWKWREEQSQKRIPFNRRSAADMILRAMRYERLLSLGAPEIVVTEEGRCLAEEMVIYYFGKEEPIIWE